MTDQGPDGPQNPPPPDPDLTKLVQMNVRVPLGLRLRIDERRAGLVEPLSRDKWITRAVEWALQHPPEQRGPQRRRQLVAQNETGRTARVRRP